LNIQNNFLSKSKSFQFAFLTTAFAFILGIIAYTIPFASSHIYFFISAPIATFIPAYFIWLKSFKTVNDNKKTKLLSISISLTIISHYLNFVILGIGRLLCNYLTGGCTDYSGEVESLIGTLTYISILQTSISLYYWGILSFSLIFVSGLFIFKINNT